MRGVCVGGAAVTGMKMGSVSFFCNDPTTTGIYTLSLRDALPVFDGVDPVIVVKTQEWSAVAELCRDDSRLGFDLLSCITGVDYPEREGGAEIEVIYNLEIGRAHV